MCAVDYELDERGECGMQLLSDLFVFKCDDHCSGHA